MNKYTIEYDFTTGDSYSLERLTEILDCISWNNLEIAKENLKRIKEHYEFYYREEKTYSRRKKVKPPTWWKTNNNHIYCVNLKTDNGKEFQLYCPWCGYFETLHGATIIENDSDMSFRTGY